MTEPTTGTRPSRTVDDPLAPVVTRGYSGCMVTNVRGAKAKLSELLERASRGEEVIITSDGKPKARLVAIETGAQPYRVHHDLLRVRPKGPIRPAEVLIREERDGRD